MNRGTDEYSSDSGGRLAEVERELAAARGRIEELTSELDATNRGIIALHSELESARDAEARARAEREVAAERDRIAHSLYDLVIHRAFGASMELQNLAGQIRQPPIVARVKAVIRGLDTTIEELRTAIFGLHGQPQEARSLRTLLADAVNESSSGLGHDPAIELQGPIDAAVPDHIAADLLALTRTALSNIAHHTGTTSTDILVRATTEELLLRIDDTGTGLAQTTTISGVGDIAERTATHGGTFQITTTPGEPTRLHWRVPLPGSTTS